MKTDYERPAIEIIEIYLESTILQDSANDPEMDDIVWDGDM